MLFLLIITPIVHFLLAKTKFTITRIIIVLLQEIIQTMIWKRIYANRTKWFSYFLILFGTIIPYMLYLDKDIAENPMLPQLRKERLPHRLKGRLRRFASVPVPYSAGRKCPAAGER